MNLTDKQKRIIVSPLISIYALVITLVMVCFPLAWLIPLINLYGLILQPFIWLIRKAGTKIEYVDYSMFDETNYIALNYIIGIFSFVLMPFYIVHIYVKENRLAF